MKLNIQQEEAVEQISGPVLILAGAGSGKTRVLTERIANLISNYNVFPYNILAVTFTNKAAKEMKERVSHRIGEDIAKSLWIGTFHSICSKILRTEIKALNRNSNFVIYDTTDQTKLITECLKKMNLDEKLNQPSNLLKQISKAKSNGYTPEEYTNEFRDFQSQKMGEIYYLYQEELRKNNAMDFDDILFHVVRIFKDFPEILQKYQKKFRYIMVDEYQDTNQIQYKLIKMLAEHYQNICVVGDVDQSIYSFRNADFRIILNFQNDYKNAKIIKLEKNYRSTQNIVNLSNEIIKENNNRFPKKLETDNETGEKIRIYEAQHEQEEVRFIIREIYKWIERGYDYGDFTILYRTNAQSRVFEEYFVRNNIPHQIVGGFKFFERKEIKDILSYLKVIFNPNDSISLQRIINYPKRGIGSTTIEKLNQIATAYNMSLWDILNFQTFEGISPNTQKTIREFVEIINNLVEKSNYASISNLIKTILSETNFIEEVQKEDEKKEKDNNRIDNIYQLISSANEFEMSSDDTTLEAYLNYISLISDADSVEEQNRKVKIMTIHNSKGLEFPIVFTAGLCEGLFPHANSTSSDEIEEERRLMYVAITRAKKVLYLTFPRIRSVYGNEQSCMPSRLISECPPHLTYGYTLTKKNFQEFNDDYTYFENNKKENKKKRYQDDFIDEASYEYKPKTSKKINFSSLQQKLESRYSDGDFYEDKKYYEGQIVYTEAWGEGKIVKIMENPKKTILVVNFETVSGSKLIDPNITKLTKK
ncbi:MAG: 3'-5' exonuclease [Candidatus Sericytochromatia bacterium]